jgi:hypothetical protein
VSAEAGEVHGAAKGCADGVKAPAKYRVEAVAAVQHGCGVGARRMQPLEGADKSRVSLERGWHPVSMQRYDVKTAKEGRARREAQRGLAVAWTSARRTSGAS